MQKWEKKAIVIGAIVLLVIIIVYTSYTYYAYHQLEIHDVKINKLSDLSLEGFTLDGELRLYNPTFVRVFIGDIEYDILVNNNKIGGGFIDGEKLYGRQTEVFEFRNELMWHPSLDYLKRILSEKRTHFSIRGNVHITKFGINMYIPFEDSLDLEQYIPEMILGRGTGNVLATEAGKVMKAWE
ncbi:MAG: LEA type 2 family protein [Nanoarchaeota archaeon]|nr:LEA type 2 family protein [Nanoarchaeota archaeon]